jgi:hypothetical protein
MNLPEAIWVKVSAWLSNHAVCEIGITSLVHQVVKVPKTQIFLNVTEKAADNKPSEVSCTLKLVLLQESSKHLPPCPLVTKVTLLAFSSKMGS